jgi:hypothetical protein
MTVVAELKIPTAEFKALFLLAPGVTFYHVRDTMGGIFGSHRRTFLKRTDVKLRRLGRAFRYKVKPKDKKRKFYQDLGDITGEAYTTSTAALGLEKGGTIRPKRGRFLIIPLGEALTTTGRLKKRWSPGRRPKSLVVLPDNFGVIGPRIRNRGLMLFWPKKVGKGRVLIPVFRLVRSVTIKKRLGFMRTWDQLSSDRDQRFSRAMDKIVSDIAKGKKR